MHLICDVRFDKNYNYYNSNLNVSENVEIINEKNLNIKNDWNNKNDEFFL